VLLLGKQLPAECEQADHLLRQLFRLFEPLRVQQDLSDEFVVGDGHRHWPEELL
jgi:hypothetical protein